VSGNATTNTMDKAKIVLNFFCSLAFAAILTASPQFRQTAKSHYTAYPMN
jgi:hypothetical protein